MKKTKITMVRENELSKIVIGSAIKVHRSLGPGLLESAYQECLFYEINQLGISVEKEKAISLIYGDVKMACGFRVDLLLEEKLVVELKAVEVFHDIHIAQLITYLKLTNCKLGLLINFNVTLLKHGIKRVIL